MTPVTIDAIDDPRIGDFRVVSDPALMRERGLFVAEGSLAVERLLASRFRTRALLVTESALVRLAPAIDASIAASYAAAPSDTAAPSDAAAPSVVSAPAPDLYVTGSAELRRITGFRFHRGCLALGERPPGGSTPGGLPPPRAGAPVVTLDAVADPDNVGAIFRNAAAFGAAGVLLSPRCADPLYRKAIRTSMATTLSLPFQVAATDDWPGPLERLRDDRARLIALTPAPGAADLGSVTRSSSGGPLVLIAGNEGDGVSQAVLERCDATVRIPLDPAVDSLNVATAVAIVLQRFHEATGHQDTLPG
ncbi:MAG: RNA methyltransferase [Acidobacteria bacterium]|nr:RNA methyltransferase [Acidobacteriota bacterium]